MALTIQAILQDVYFIKDRRTNMTITSSRKVLLSIIVAVFLFSFPVMGQDAKGREKMIVATKHAPPFAMKNVNGEWHGVSIDLWREMAEELGIEYEFKEVSLKDMLTGLEKGEYDAAVAALTITADRESKMDFTHPFHSSGLGIAVASDSKSSVLSILLPIFSQRFLKALMWLSLVLFATGFAVWFFERKKNPEQFGSGHSKGIFDSFWWSATTMTTVGYGDRAPTTLGGKIMGMIWMFTSVIIISSFTASIASSLTTARIETMVQGEQDLDRVKVATVLNSTSEAYLKSIFVRKMTTYPNVNDAMQALAKGECDAVVYDAPIIRYLLQEPWAESLAILPRNILRQDYGIALPSKSELREPINHELLLRVQTKEWEDGLNKYMDNQ
jgi:polar amino acid transport system substrate-binding protein